MNPLEQEILPEIHRLLDEASLPGGYFDGRAKGANTIVLRAQGLIDEAKHG